MEVASAVARVARRTVEGRTHAPDVISWIETNPVELQNLLDNFDKVINRFNSINLGEPPVSLINAIIVKGELSQDQLPTFNTIISQSQSAFSKGFRSFVNTLKDMNKMMERGETTQAEPFLAFHKTETDTPALVIGGIFHTYEEMLMRDPKFSGRFKWGQLVDALVETLAEDKTNPLYDAVANKSRLDWIDGWEGFSEQFRKENGFN